MPTINQLVTRSISRRKKPTARKSLLLGSSPQKRAVCMRVYVRKPKKPNSALRKLAKVRVSNRQLVIAYIPGEGHNLQEHSVVLLRGGRVQDLPGVKYKLIRGQRDLVAVRGRKQGRSKYGAKRAA